MRKIALHLTLLHFVKCCFTVAEFSIVFLLHNFESKLSLRHTNFLLKNFALTIPYCINFWVFAKFPLTFFNIPAAVVISDIEYWRQSGICTTTSLTDIINHDLYIVGQETTQTRTLVQLPDPIELKSISWYKLVESLSFKSFLQK